MTLANYGEIGPAPFAQTTNILVVNNIRLSDLHLLALKASKKTMFKVFVRVLDLFKVSKLRQTRHSRVITIFV